MNRPRLLVATEYSAHAYGGGPTVIRQLLKEMDPGRVGWWSVLPPPSRTREWEVGYSRWVGVPPKLYPHRRWPRLKSALLAHCWVPGAARHLERCLNEWEPEAIWLIPHQWAIPIFQRVFGNGRRGYHISIQDYPDILDRPQRFGIRRTAAWAQGVDHLYRQATTADATSEPMGEDLAHRTGRSPDGILHYGLEAEDFTRLQRLESDRPADRIRLACTGSINDNQEFQYLVKSLRTVQSQVDRPLELDFFGGHDYRRQIWFDAKWMRWLGDWPQAELVRRLADYDWGICVMSVTDDQPRYHRYSFPTKFITYLAGGTPVLALGHPQSSLIRMAGRYSTGVCLDGCDETTMLSVLKGALQQNAPRRRYQDGLAECAREEFDAARNRRNLMTWLNRQCPQELAG